MDRSPIRAIHLAVGLVVLFVTTAVAWADDTLPSWNDGAAKSAIVAFVVRVTQEGSPDFVPPAQRIATFDNDGTLWSEQPAYFQLAFAFYRIKVMAPKHPEWKDKQPYKAVLEGDMQALAAAGEKGLLELMALTHAGMTTDEFATAVADWCDSAEHPRFKRPYIDLVFQPMLELLSYLRDNGFKTFIVSGGGVEFMRPMTEKAYGIPPEQVVGSTITTQYALVGDIPVLNRLPKVDFVDDGPGKPVGINKFIGRRPILAAGNSDGDYEMLCWVMAGHGPHFAMIIHHTDADREYAYDRKSDFGKLDKALDEATAKQWVVVDVKRDWKVIYPFQR